MFQMLISYKTFNYIWFLGYFSRQAINYILKNLIFSKSQIKTKVQIP
jgi:hypothetical protein